jgi:hypothetical protein
MTVMYFMHGLFLTCTQNISFVFTRHASQYWQDVQAIFLKPSCINKVTTLYLLGGPASCSWWQISIHPGPHSGNNCSTPWLWPLSHLSHPQFTLHYLHRWHQHSWSSSLETVAVSRR